MPESWGFPPRCHLGTLLYADVGISQCVFAASVSVFRQCCYMSVYIADVHNSSCIFVYLWESTELHLRGNSACNLCLIPGLSPGMGVLDRRISRARAEGILTICEYAWQLQSGERGFSSSAVLGGGHLAVHFQNAALLTCRDVVRFLSWFFLKV